MPVTRRTRIAALAAAVAAGPLISVTAGSGTAAAHGSLGSPVSRVLSCYAEGPEHPKSAACKAAVQAGGPQALYDWNGIRIGDAAGRSKQIVPDGKLCSAGNAEFTGLDLPRADWPATTLTSGAAYTFRFRWTAAHTGTFSLYSTKQGYDPSKPLTWSELDDKPFATAVDPQRDGEDYLIEGKLPKRTGRQLIYVIWQRSDSPEAFYSCSDVDYGGGAAADSASPASAKEPTSRQLAAGADRSSMAGMAGMHRAAGASKTGSRHLAETGTDAAASLPLIGAGLAAIAAGGLLMRGAFRRARAGR